MVMKMSKHVVILFFVLVLFCSLFAVPCSAINTGFDIEDVNEDEMPVIFERFDLEMIDEPKITNGFSCFDVNEFGDYTLGFDIGNTDVILFCSSNGEYLYGFSVADNGAFGIEWDNENIIIYRVRSDLAVLIDKDGNCLDMKKS